MNAALRHTCALALLVPFALADLAACGSGEVADLAAQPAVAALGADAGATLTWEQPAKLHTGASCESFIAAARAAAKTWVGLEIERARRHADELGVALAPQPLTPQTANAPILMRDGQPVERRDRVTLEGTTLVVATDRSVTFVRAVPAGDMTELASVALAGTPWTMAAVDDSHDQLLVIARVQAGTADEWTEITRIDVSAVVAGTGDPVVMSTESLPGALTMAARVGDDWRVVTSGRMALDQLTTWPEELSPHASDQEREQAFARLAHDLADAIDALGLEDLLPAQLAQHCDGGAYPETFLGPGWLAVTELTPHEAPDSHSMVTSTLPILGAFAAVSANTHTLALAGTNWPYFWFFEQDPPADGGAPAGVQTEIHLIDGAGVARSTRVQGAPTGANALLLKEATLIVATTEGSSFLGGGFKPQGPTRLTSLTSSLDEITTLLDAGGEHGEAVGHVRYTESLIYVIPEAADGAVQLVTAESSGDLARSGILHDGGVRYSILPLTGARVAVVGRPEEGSAMAAEVRVYDVSDPAAPTTVGQPMIIGKEVASEVTVDAEGVATLDSERLIVVPLQVTANDTATGYWEQEPRLEVFELDGGGVTKLGEVSHGDLAAREHVPLTCGDIVTDRRITGGAVKGGVLYSVSSFGVLAHDLEALADGPIGDTLLSYGAECATESD